MIKRFIALLLLIGLTGCQQKEPTVQELKQQVSNNAVVFDEDISQQAIQDKSAEYKNLFNKVYAKALGSISYDIATDKFTCKLYNLEDYQKIVQQDTSGFQKDYENMVKLEVAQNTIDNYVYTYCANALGACGVTKFVFELDLGAHNSYSSNTVIVNEVTTLIDNLYSGSVNYTKGELVTEWSIPETPLELGVGKVLCVSCEGKTVNCFVRIDSVLLNKEAEEYVRGLSSVNSNIRFPQGVVLVTYTIMNLGTESAVFEDKLLSVNENGNVITYNNNDIVGLENVKSLEPKVETTISNLYVVDDSGVMLWYDEGTTTSLQANILSN